MPEILTESFCERCGTRYTFESAAPACGAPVKGIKVLSRGLKNFVLSDDTSMDEAMAAARSETDREVTSQQLDAFHKTFNFCMTCRQYTCGNCWNEAEGRCLSCAPHLGHEILPAPFPDLDPRRANGVQRLGANGVDDGMPTGTPRWRLGEALAWPTMDLDRTSDDDDASADEAPRATRRADRRRRPARLPRWSTRAAGRRSRPRAMSRPRRCGGRDEPKSRSSPRSRSAAEAGRRQADGRQADGGRSRAVA